MKKVLRKNAEQLRNEGWSYSIISERLGISKGTLSCWLREIPFRPNKEVKKRVNEALLKSVMCNHRKKIDSIKKMRKVAKKEIGSLTKRDLWMIGIGLYIGEGAKHNESIRIINSNPKVINLALEWFQKVCHLKTDNFNLAIHLYPDNSIKKTLNFWSKKTKIPKSQFGKTQIDRRINKSWKKRRKLPYGTAHLTIKSCGDKNYGVLLHRRIIGWINAIYKNLRV